MKTNIEKEKFIELRAKGFSFSKISTEIGVSKQTLIRWNSDLRETIANRRFLDAEELLDRYQLTKTARLEMFARTLSKALEELQTRTLGSLTFKELLNLIGYLESRLSEEATTMSYKTDEIASSWILDTDQPIRIPLLD